jgi:hypothetical protein
MPAVLVILNDIDPAVEAQYETWYWHDHLPQRWELFGRRPARRYRRVAGDGRGYFTFYEVADLSAFDAPDYQATLREPTEGTRRIMPHFRNMVRSLCTPVLDIGSGTAGALAVLSLEPDDGTAERLRYALAPAFDRLTHRPGITRCRLWQTDVAATRAPNPESRLRGDSDAWVPWLVVVEGISPEGAGAAARELARDATLAAARPPASPACYSLLNALP